MSDPNEAWREAQRRRWLRPNGQLYVRGDAYRFAASGTPEAKMPGWLDPSMTRVRWKEAQEEAARQLEAERQEELERDLLELRWLVKSLRTDLLLRDLRHKYDPTQPRVPAGNPQGGQWTSVTGSVGDAAAAADGSGDDSAGTDGDAGDAAQSDASGADTAPFSPDRRGWHDYTAGPNLVCGADLSCSREEIADQLARFSVPGRDPSKPVVDLERSFIVDPRTGAPVGWVDTDVENNGLRIVNRTTILHALYDGKVVRSATQDEDGAWRVTTRGFGNNILPGFNLLNQEEGPLVFNLLDQRMRENIERHHAKGVLALSICGLGGGVHHGRVGALAGAHYV